MIATMWFMGASDVKYGYWEIAGMVASSKEACRNFRGSIWISIWSIYTICPIVDSDVFSANIELSSIIVIFGW